MKKQTVGITSLCVLLFFYFGFIYMLFDWPESYPLLIIGILVITISGIIKGYKIVPIFTTVGYIAGFFAGGLRPLPSNHLGGSILFRTWYEFWILSYAAAIITGIVIEVFIRKKHKQQ